MKAFFVAAGAWLKKAGAWTAKNWKLVGGLLLAVFGAIAVTIVIKKIVQVIEGIVNPSSAVKWAPVGGNPNQVTIQAHGATQIIDLPKGVTADKVKNIGLDVTDQSIAVVEVNHEVIDRRNAATITNNALDALGSK